MRAIRLLTPVLLLVGSSCADQPTDPVVTPSIRFAENARLVADQGTGHLVPVQLERFGVNGRLRLRVAGLPDGVSARFDPEVVEPGVSQSTLRISVSNATEPGSYAVALSVLDDTGIEGRGTLDLSVRFVDFAFMIGADRPALALAPGQGGTLRLFAGTTTTGRPLPVTLRFDGLPNGINGSIGDADHVARISLDPGIALGSYEIAVVGEASNGARARLLIPLLVAASAVDFTAPPRIDVGRGQAITVTIPLVRAAADGVPVTFTIDGHLHVDAMAGWDGAVTPKWVENPVRTMTAGLELNVGANVAPGAYALTLTSNAPGLPTQRQDILLVVH